MIQIFAKVFFSIKKEESTCYIVIELVSYISLD